MSCSNCWPWNLPLAVPAQRLTDGQQISMRYEQWITWDWHVKHHQKNPDGTHQWGGELTLTKEAA